MSYYRQGTTSIFSFKKTKQYVNSNLRRLCICVCVCMFVPCACVCLGAEQDL